MQLIPARTYDAQGRVTGKPLRARQTQRQERGQDTFGFDSPKIAGDIAMMARGIGQGSPGEAGYRLALGHFQGRTA